MEELIKKLPHTHPYKANGSVFGASNVWGPSTLDNTLAGFDAAVATSLDSTDWLDQSGNGNDTTFTGSPTVTKDSYVSFDGSSQGGDFGLLSSIQAVTFVVRLDTSSIGLDTIFATTSDTNSIRLGANAAEWNTATTTGNAGDFVHSDGNIYVNGVDSDSSELGSWTIVYAIGGDSSDGTMSKMFLPAALTRYGHGDLAEVWFLSSHSDEQRLLFEGYFAHKWGLQHKLQSDHVYKNDGARFGFSNAYQFDIADLFQGRTSGLWIDASRTSQLWEEVDESKATAASVDGVVGHIEDLSGLSDDPTSVLDAERPILKESSGLYHLEFDGTDDGFSFDQLTGIEYVAMALDVDSTINAFGSIFTQLKGSVGNTMRLNSLSTQYRDPGTAASADDFTVTDGNTFVDGVDTPILPNDTPHVAEFLAGSTTEGTMGAIAYAETGNRFFKGGIYALIALDYTPSSAQRTTIRNYLAGLSGVSL